MTIPASGPETACHFPLIPMAPLNFRLLSMQSILLHLVLSFIGLSMAGLPARADDPPKKPTVSGPISEAGFEPPGKGTDPQGVVAAWKAGVPLAPTASPEVALGDSLVVRVRNLDGWLMDRMGKGPMPGQTIMSEAQRELWLAAKKENPSIGKYASEMREKARADAATAEKRLGEIKKELEDQSLAAPKKQELQAEQKKETDRQKKAAEDLKRADEIAAAQRAFNALLDSVKEDLFLVLGNAHLRALQPRNPFVGKIQERESTDHDLEFRLLREPGDEPEWKKLYTGTHYRNPMAVRIGVRLGTEESVLNSAVMPNAVHPNQRFIYLLWRPWRLAIAVAIVVVAIVCFIRLAGPSDILRDPDAPFRPDGCRQYSLARSQMAFWFFLVIAAYLFLWVVTLRTDTLNGTALALVGIGAATALGSVAVTQVFRSGKPKTPEVATQLFYTTRMDPQTKSVDSTNDYAGRRHESLEARRQHLKTLLDEARKVQADKTDLAKIRRTEALSDASLVPAAEELEKEAAESAALAEKYSYHLQYLSWATWRQMLEDWLTDGEKVTLHRFQMIVWTIVLGFIFVVRTLDTLEMAEFSDTLLALLGISSGTYLGFKVPEVQQQSGK